MEMVKNAQPDSGESDSGQYQPQFQPMIRDLPNGERPRERLREYGSRYLSNTELIAILLRTGVKGQNVLSLSSSLQAGGTAWPGWAAALSPSCAPSED